MNMQDCKMNFYELVFHTDDNGRVYCKLGQVFKERVVKFKLLGYIVEIKSKEDEYQCYCKHCQEPFQFWTHAKDKTRQYLCIECLEKIKTEFTKTKTAPKMFIDEGSRCFLCPNFQKKEWLLAFTDGQSDIRICEDCLRRGLDTIERKRKQVGLIMKEQQQTDRFLDSLERTGNKII